MSMLSLSRLRSALAAMLAASATLPVLAQAPSAAAPQTDLPRTVIQVGMHRIEAQVASTPAQRQTGLMRRQDMPQHEGMLFAFERPGTQCFWMKDTLIPLTVAFLADDGSIVNLADMKPLDLQSHCSTQPVRYVLEMNEGWFRARGIKPGQKLKGAAFQAP